MPKDERSSSLTVVPPIQFDGTTLLMPAASSIRDGYVTKEDFAIFLGTIMGVTQINTGAGLAGGPITSTGTISIATVPGVAGVHTNPSSITCNAQGQITAISSSPGGFLPASGGTMTGPLILHSDPAGPMEAATRQFVLASTGGSASVLPATWIGSDFGVSGSANRFSGTIPNGSTTLTTTAVTDFQVGHGIYIKGAGASGGDLLTKVTAVSGTTITLQNPAQTVITTAVPNNVQHDDTVAIQTAINTAWNAGGGDLILAPGLHRCNGPFTSTDSILTAPYSAPQGGGIIGLKIKGMAPSFPAWYGPQNTGTIIQSDKVKATANSSIFATAWWDAGTNWTTVNNLFLTLEDICFRTYDDPNLNALDLGMCAMADVKNVTCDTGVTLTSGAMPTHNTFGIRVPRTNTAGNTNTTNVFVCNYAIGFITGEIWTSFGTIGAERCLVAFQLHEGWHLTGGVSRLAAYQCPKILEITQPCCLDLVIDFENAPDGSAWYADAGTDFYDPNNYATGSIRYIKIRDDAPNSGESIPASFVGFEKCNVTALGGLGTVLARPSAPTAGTVALTVRNSDISIGGNINGQSNLQVTGNISGTDIRAAGTLKLGTDIISRGAANSATETGFKELRVPNVSAPISPTDVPGLVQWQKADALGLANGASVASWTDSGPNGFALTQATTANRPIFQTAQVNGLPAIKFDGLTQVLEAGTAMGTKAQPNAFYYVIKIPSTANGDLQDQKISGSGNRNLIAFDTGTYKMYAGTVVETTAVIRDQFFILETIFNGPSSLMTVNGATVLSGNIGNQAYADAVIGGAENGSFPFPGWIAERIFYNALPSTTNRTSLRAYLGTKYNITTS